MAGRIIAGPHVRAACRRHLADLDRIGASGFDFRWDVEKVARVIRFFSTALKLDGGAASPKAFVPEPWQAFVVGSIFGWVDADGFRRFRVAFVETGKGSGKSPLAAGIGLYMLMSDGERRAEVYAAAVDKEQAGILFRDAVSMSKLSSAIDRRVVRSGGDGKEYNIAFLSTGSFFRPISSESQGRGKSGYRPHCVLLDEVHEHPTNAMVEFMRAGTKGRRQALIFMITNSGVDRTSVCFEYHTHGVKVAAGETPDDAFFSYICALDEGEDPFENSGCWAKANPSIGVTFQSRYLEEQVTGAKGMPSKGSIVRRLNFCEWVDAASPWIDGEMWRACEDENWAEPGADRPCYLSLDLSLAGDLTALSETWPGEERADARLTFWTPGDTITQREIADRAPYRTWVRDGYLHAVPGKLVKYSFVADAVSEILASRKIVALIFDQWRIKEFRAALDDASVDNWIGEWDAKNERWNEEDRQQPGSGLLLIRHGQGYAGGLNESTLWMPRSISALEEAVLTKRLRVKYNPVLRWNSASAVLEQDATGNKKWEKRKSTGRIDGIVALSMGVGASAGVAVAAASVYEGRGILIL